MTNFIFDFDSTLVKNETLNDILKMSLNGDVEKIRKIEEITQKAMNGLISPRESMESRLRCAIIKKSVVKTIIEKTKNQIVENMIDIIEKLKQKANIFIVSGGFFEVIYPTADILGINKNNIFANKFIYNNDIVVGVENSILLEEQGKVKLINKLKKEKILLQKNIMIGDGWTDFETYKFNAVDNYICFSGVVKRNEVIKNSKLIAEDSNQLLKICLNLI